MRMAKKTILIITLILVVVGSADAAKTGRMTAREKRTKAALKLLNKYAQTQDKQRSYICKWKVATKKNAKFSGPPYGPFSGKTRGMSLYEFRYDGERYSNARQLWGNIGLTSKKNIPKGQGPYNSERWDGQTYFLYIAVVDHPGKVYPDRLSIYNRIRDLPKNMRDLHKGLNRYGPGIGLVRGYLGDIERIDYTLGKVKILSVRDKTEKIRGVECYVIDAEDKNSKYTLWLDPEHGYNTAKAKVKRKKPNWFFSLEKVRFKEIDGIWVIEEAVITRVKKFKNGDFTNVKMYCNLTEISLNPDHEALGSFLPDDIADGTSVSLNVNGKSHDYIKGAIPPVKKRRGKYYDKRGRFVGYTWQDGKVVDANGIVAMDCRKKLKGDKK